MKACVIGLGSIGNRHREILLSLGIETVAVSRRTSTDKQIFANIEGCFSAHPNIDYVVIANETSEHINTLLEIRKVFTGTVLVEKPLSSGNLIPEISNPQQVFIAYNLRFHPVLQRIKTLIKKQEIISAHIYVGQHLASWRPGTDYKSSYSSNRAKGGGVLRDLSHELDYCLWLFGEPTKLAAISGKFSNLEIDSDDSCTALYQTPSAATVTVSMNYIDHISQRKIIINTNEITIAADLIKGVIQVNDKVETFITDRNSTYIEQHLAVIQGKNKQSLCNLSAANKVQQLIADIESQEIQ